MTRRRVVLVLLGLAALAAAYVCWPRPLGPTGAWMARAGVTPRFLDAAGWRVRYVRAGQGTPVLLLHGFASSSYTWSDVLPGLAREHEVVALDFPGFGGSEVRPGLTAADLVRAVPAVVDGLGLGRVDLVGHSLGGAVASVVAADRPELCRRLVLIDAAGFNLAPEQRPAILRALGHVPPALFERLPLSAPAVRLGLRQVFHDRALLTPERVAEYTTPLVRPGTSAALRSLLGSRDEMGVPGLVARIRQPTLVLWGRDDRWIALEQSERFVSAIPGARRVVLDGCGHVPQEEKPRETEDLLRRFLAEPAAN